VLVISGSRAFRRLLHRFLEQHGHQSVAVDDGDDAFSSIAFSRPSVVILDLRDGDADRLLFHGLLRRRHPEVPVLALIADRLRLCHRGADVLVEPAASDPAAPHPLLATLRRSVEELVLNESLDVWRPPPARA
jgi:DNA-binding response OmpR family regulator